MCFQLYTMTWQQHKQYTHVCWDVVFKRYARQPQIMQIQMMLLLSIYEQSQLKEIGLFFDGECFHIRCFVHILNLIIKAWISEIKESISNLHEYVKYVRSFASRLQLFKICADEMRVISKRVLCLDVPLNSTYLILDPPLEFEKVFE